MLNTDAQAKPKAGINTIEQKVIEIGAMLANVSSGLIGLADDLEPVLRPETTEKAISGDPQLDVVPNDSTLYTNLSDILDTVDRLVYRVDTIRSRVQL